MREIVLDTETTGLDAKAGDRLIEIGCVELVNRIPSGREFHRFINPQRDVPAEAVAVHGLSGAFLQDKPLFADVAGDFLEFIGEDGLVIHNAAFDIGFLNAELGRVSLGEIGMDRVTCTLQLARRRHPAGPNNLDALCKRYGIDNTKRTKHGALVDSLLLAEVYIELLGVRQAALGLAMDSHTAFGAEMAPSNRAKAAQRPAPHRRRPDARRRLPAAIAGSVRFRDALHAPAAGDEGGRGCRSEELSPRRMVAQLVTR
jgi:DNA polymerase-3 subunit epsilon